MTNFTPNLDHIQSDASITDASEFAERMLIDFVRQYMIDAGITQEEAAERSGLRQAHISRMLAGKYPPKLRTFLKLAGALGLRIEMMERVAGEY